MKISIIMPVYNCEFYLKEAIASILNQSYSNFELIIINDGSIDNSEAIINKFLKTDDRIIYKYINNNGVSNARNVGLSFVTGDYIAFVDSDDKIEKTFLEELIKGIKDYDLCVSGYKLYYPKGVNNIILNTFENNTDYLIKSIFSNNFIGGFCCNKLFKANIIKDNNIRFNSNISICEDLLFVVEYISYIKSFNYVSLPLYYYRMRKSSATMNKSLKKAVSELMAYDLMLNLDFSNELKQYIGVQYLKCYYKNKNYFKELSIDKNYLFSSERIFVKNCLSFKDKIKFYFIKYKFYKYIIILKKCFSKENYFF